ncbi:MAG: CsbD family protein [Gammaproteobacteria bacterium]
MKKVISNLMLLCIVSLPALGLASSSEKAKATSEQVTGSVESTAGTVLGNDKMKSEGKTKKLKGDLRSTKEDIKDKIIGN